MRKISFAFLIAVCSFFNTALLKAQKIISFTAKDGLNVTADLYFISDTLPYMILCHQGGSSRGEYNETAPKFTKFRYNCIAVDSRSGDKINEVKNETVLAAKTQSKKTTYLDAEQDIVAAIDYAFEKSHKKVIVVGSSYTASLALKIGVANDNVKAVIAFSPAEYFGAQLNLKDAIKQFDKPVFISSSQDEAGTAGILFNSMKSEKKQQFIPAEKGVHGSKALWKVNPGYREYWQAMTIFMQKVK